MKWRVGDTWEGEAPAEPLPTTGVLTLDQSGKSLAFRSRIPPVFEH